jgi:hypothetical protein
MTQQPTATLVVRVYPSGTRGRVLIQTEQKGPVHLTSDEIARTLRSAAKQLDDDGAPVIARTLRSAAEQFDRRLTDATPVQRPHGYFDGSTGWCIHLAGGRVCGEPWDAPVHGLDQVGLPQPNVLPPTKKPGGADDPRVVDIRELVKHHPDDDCPGITECEQLQQIWRDLAGGVAGTCVLCDGVHWPWEPHRENP